MISSSITGSSQATVPPLVRSPYSAATNTILSLGNVTSHEISTQAATADESNEEGDQENGAAIITEDLRPDINEQILRLLTALQDPSMDNLHGSALQCVLLVLSLIPLLINLSNKGVHHLRTLVYCPGRAHHPHLIHI
jgi:hypothetical protein